MIRKNSVDKITERKMSYQVQGLVASGFYHEVALKSRPLPMNSLTPTTGPATVTMMNIIIITNNY